MNRSDFQQLADTRLAEAKALLSLEPPLPCGAYYLGGYAIECALKACIAKRYVEHVWPEKKYVDDCHTHDIYKLVKMADLTDSRESDSALNDQLARNWLTVKDWNEHVRYTVNSVEKALELINAIEYPQNGVLSWLKARW